MNRPKKKIDGSTKKNLTIERAEAWLGEWHRFGTPVAHHLAVKAGPSASGLTLANLRAVVAMAKQLAVLDWVEHELHSRGRMPCSCYTFLAEQIRIRRLAPAATRQGRR